MNGARAISTLPVPNEAAVGRTPFYRKVASELVARIRAGEFASDGALPTEAQLERGWVDCHHRVDLRHPASSWTGRLLHGESGGSSLHQSACSRTGRGRRSSQLCESRFNFDRYGQFIEFAHRVGRRRSDPWKPCEVPSRHSHAPARRARGDRIGGCFPFVTGGFVHHRALSGGGRWRVHPVMARHELVIADTVVPNR